MDKKDIKILIVEDDKSFGSALAEAISIAGYKAIHVTKPDDAINSFKIQDIHAMVFDCLLPSKSGVDLAAELRAQGATCPMFFMSAIYKDKAFMKDAIQKTGALGFLTKPFDLNDLVEKLNTTLSDSFGGTTEPLHALLEKDNSTPGERIQAINQTEILSGRELPFVLNLLLHPSISGVLKLKDESSKESEVHFLNENIVSADVKDPKSFFGAILVDKNFVDPGELEMVLAKPSDKRVGERLVEENLISPHTIEIVNSEQMGIRLSKLVGDTSYEVSFETASVRSSQAFIDRNRLSRFISDWVASKYTLKFLKNHYLPREELLLIRTPLFDEYPSVFLLPPLAHLPKLIESIKTSSQSLTQLLHSGLASEEEIYSAIHLLTLTGLIAFDRTQKTEDFDVMIKRLKKIETEMEEQNLFDILGITPKARAAEVKKSYHELAKVFHPDKVPSGAPQDLRDMVDRVFTQMTRAYETLNDPNTRSIYQKELEQGQAEFILQSEGLLEEGKAALKAGQAKKAHSLFQKAISLRPPTAEITLYSLWARMLCLSSADDKVKELKEIEHGLNTIPPEERHTAIYYFVKGFFQKNLGNVDLAKRNMQQALSLNHTFIEAKRELNVLTLSENGKVDILKSDLKDVIGHLFKKKKKTG